MKSTTLTVATSTAAAVLAILYVWRRRRRWGVWEAVSPRTRGLRALQDNLALRKAFQAKIGLDIGGTLAKIVLRTNDQVIQRVSLSPSTTARPELTISTGDSAIHFLTVPTHLLESTCESIRDRMSWPSTDGNLREIVAAGGGGHRFRDMFRATLQVALLPFKELEAVVSGLLFLAEHGPPRELFTVHAADGGEDGGEVDVEWPSSPLFPFLLVNLGSGVSILRVDSPTKFTRVGGTACGGATFLGLARALTGVSDFQELMSLAAHGSEAAVDKSVGDIYGEVGCAHLGLPATFTAASFGRLATAPAASLPRPERPSADCVRALLRMVAQASVVLAKAYASSSDCMERIFFVGGFVGAPDNELAREMISESMRSVGGRAIFCRHAEFLGALGSLATCVKLREQRVVGSA